MVHRLKRSRSTAIPIKLAPGEVRYTTIGFHAGAPTMSAVGKAIWFIETHFAGDISLDDIAKVGRRVALLSARASASRRPFGHGICARATPDGGGAIAFERRA